MKNDNLHLLGLEISTKLCTRPLETILILKLYLKFKSHEKNINKCEKKTENKFQTRVQLFVLLKLIYFFPRFFQVSNKNRR